MLISVLDFCAVLFQEKKLMDVSQAQHSFRKNTGLTVVGIPILLRLLVTTLEFCADCIMHDGAKVEPINI